MCYIPCPVNDKETMEKTERKKGLGESRKKNK